MPKIKPFNIAGLEDVVDAEPTYRDVPVPPKGSYEVRLKRMTYGSIHSGPNAGAPRFNCLLELVGPKSADEYVGYGFWHGLNLTKQGAGYVNQFINALAESSGVNPASLRKSFWGSDIIVDDEGHVQKIGKIRISSPDGQIRLDVTTKMGKDRDGNPRGDISSVLTPRNITAKPKDEEIEDEEEDDDEILDDVEDDVEDDDEILDDDDEDEDDRPF